MGTTPRTPASVFAWNGVPPAGQLIPLGLQHVVAAVVGVITPAIIVSSTCGLSDADTTLMIQVSLILTALATLLQLFPLFRRLGSGLPVIMGISFAYVPTLTSIGGAFGLGTILGAEIEGGCVDVLFGIFLKQIRRFFPPLVTGTVIFTIGLSLYPTAVKYMAGGAGQPDFGSWKNWLVAFITLAVVFVLNNFTKGVLKLGAILWGMAVGYVVALLMGMVSFDSVAAAGYFQAPVPLYFPIEFNVAACVSMAIMYIVNSVQTMRSQFHHHGRHGPHAHRPGALGRYHRPGRHERDRRPFRRPARRLLQPARGHRDGAVSPWPPWCCWWPGLFQSSPPC